MPLTQAPPPLPLKNGSRGWVGPLSMVKAVWIALMGRNIVLQSLQMLTMFVSLTIRITNTMFSNNMYPLNIKIYQKILKKR